MQISYCQQVLLSGWASVSPSVRKGKQYLKKPLGLYISLPEILNKHVELWST